MALIGTTICCSSRVLTAFQIFRPIWLLLLVWAHYDLKALWFNIAFWIVPNQFPMKCPVFWRKKIQFKLLDNQHFYHHQREQNVPNSDEQQELVIESSQWMYVASNTNNHVDTIMTLKSISVDAPTRFTAILTLQHQCTLLAARSGPLLSHIVFMELFIFLLLCTFRCSKSKSVDGC